MARIVATSAFRVIPGGGYVRGQEASRRATISVKLGDEEFCRNQQYWWS
jgi:hypothetical protein